MPTSGCLDEQMVVAFLGGRMAAPERQVVEQHLDDCPTCTELTTWAAADLAHRSHDSGRDGPVFIGALPPGSRVDRYQILGGIGRGGMGEVYAAYHPDLDRRIALKVVGEASADSAMRRARLLREARAIARLTHPNVIAVHDAGTFGDRVYIAMEFVEGDTVDAWLHAAPRNWRQIVDVFVAAGHGLAAAHAAGIVHRDFKPQNMMIGRDGGVRVMDFGLARLAEEPADGASASEIGEVEQQQQQQPPPTVTTVTKAGALVGTIAYMAPEQFRGEPIDARADQFSFCVALHEAVYGRRPTLAHLAAATVDAGARGADEGGETTTATRAASSPAWLRAVVARGLSENRDHRFPSMDALLAAMTRGQARERRRTMALIAGAGVALAAAGAFALGAARNVSCAVPKSRIAAVWPAGDEASPRRQAIHRAFVASGLANAEAAWQRVAAALDGYTAQWSAMYVDACEATHVRGDQSAEVLDLRMSCLGETLDGVRALTEVLSRADSRMAGQAARAAQELAPLGRCADVATLRSAVPVPRDEATVKAVAEARSALRDAFALFDVGNERAALAKAREVLPRAEATHYKPLVAETLYHIGYFQSDRSLDDAERAFEQALETAEASRDDLTAAQAAIGLVFATAVKKEQRHENQEWTRLAHAILERLPPPQRRLRAWLLNNEASALLPQRQFDPARVLLEEAMALKEAELGKTHPDVVRTGINLIWALNELGRHEDALRLANHCVEIMQGLDADNVLLAYTLNNRGDAFIGLHRYAEAESDYRTSLRIIRAQFGESWYPTAMPIVGLARAKLGEGDPEGAVHRLEQALRLQEGNDPDVLQIADTRLELARALTASGRDRARARFLATSALDTYATHDQPDKQREAAAWLAEHGGAGKQ